MPRITDQQAPQSDDALSKQLEMARKSLSYRDRFSHNEPDPQLTERLAETERAARGTR
jgi:hypothetical protein